MSELKSLAARMAAVMGDVPTMIKNGQNTAQKYAYVTAEDVKAAIRPLLKKHGIAVFSSMVDVQRETSTNKNGTHVVTVLAAMRFTLVCAETGEGMECQWYGEANDYADKAVNKAATAAEKYWLINTFLLSTTEPEADEETIAAPPLTEPQEKSSELITPEQYKKINTLGKTIYGASWANTAKQLVEVYTDNRTARATEMTAYEAEKMFDALTQIRAAELEKEQTA